MPKYSQHYFPQEPQISGKTLAACFTVILVTWMALSSLDYAEARTYQCARKSTASHEVTWDRESDTCKKERRNATTKKD